MIMRYLESVPLYTCFMYHVVVNIITIVHIS